MITPRTLNLLCFRFRPQNITDENHLNKLNENLLQTANKSGKLFITHTKLDGKYTLRLVIGQTNVTKHHVMKAWELIQSTSKELL
jgi:aromatic-L-amino-acid decarboxylase